MEIFESPCIDHEDSKISVFKPRRFLNLYVLKHGDSKISNFKIAIEERKLSLLRKNFNNMPLHTLVIHFLKKKNSKIKYFLWNLCFIHGDFYFKGL